jgi:hypothetical protein
MNPPKAITVAGLEWKVRVRTDLKHLGEAVDGLCVPDRQELLLCRSVLKWDDRTRKTLLHESLHAAFVSHKEYYDETLIAIIEDRIDELIRLNPKLMEMYGYVHRGD